MSRYELLALLTALLSIVVGSVALYRAHRVSRRQIELEEVQAAFAKFQHDVLTKEQEAKLRADVRLLVVDNQTRLLIENVGPGIAKDTAFELIMPGGRESFIVEGEVESILPVTLLPAQSIRMLIAPNLGTPRACLARITWTDAAGQRHSRDQTLTL